MLVMLSAAARAAPLKEMLCAGPAARFSALRCGRTSCSRRRARRVRPAAACAPLPPLRVAARCWLCACNELTRSVQRCLLLRAKEGGPAGHCSVAASIVRRRCCVACWLGKTVCKAHRGSVCVPPSELGCCERRAASAAPVCDLLLSLEGRTDSRAPGISGPARLSSLSGLAGAAASPCLCGSGADTPVCARQPWSSSTRCRTWQRRSSPSGGGRTRTPPRKRCAPSRVRPLPLPARVRWRGARSCGRVQQGDWARARAQARKAAGRISSSTKK